MDDDSSPYRDQSASIRFVRVIASLMTGVALVAAVLYASNAHVQEYTPADGVAAPSGVLDIFTPGALLAILLLVAVSAFLSASEVAFFGIHQLRLRTMREGPNAAERQVGNMMSHPGRLLTTILVGNMIVNVLIGVLLPSRLLQVFVELLAMPSALALALTALLSTLFLVYVCAITPKVIAARVPESFATAAAFPMRTIDVVLEPVSRLLLGLTDFLFRITRFDNIKAAPFITDEEFVGLLTRGEAQGVLEEQEGQMIQGILELSDAKLREILVPRPDVIAISSTATVEEALALFRQHEYSRMPVYSDDIDHIVGVLVAKDLISAANEGDYQAPITPLMRRPRFVPETMTVQAFVKYAQRARTHLAIVVDEYGGTEGIVTLEDAVEEVVGKIHDETEKEDVRYRKIGDNTYRVDGNLSLDELSDLIGLSIEDEEHETVAGFVMAQASKILETGDNVLYHGAEFLVEAVDGRRAARLRVHVDPAAREVDS